MRISTKGMIKRGLVWLLTTAMLLQAAPGTVLAAENVQTAAVEEAGMQDDADIDASGQEEETDGKKTGGATDESASGDTESGVQDDDDKETGDGTEDETNEEIGGTEADKESGDGTEDDGTEEADKENGDGTDDGQESSEETADGEDGEIDEESGDNADELMEIKEAEAVSSETADAANDFVISSGKLTKYTGSDTDVTIPAGVTIIGTKAFYNNKTIEIVHFTENVTIVEADAFNGCSNLKTVTNCDRLITIGESAFSYTSLQGITLPETLTTIGARAFFEAKFGNEDQYGNITTGKLTIPDSVTTIGESAFDDCDYLAEVTFENEGAALTLGKSCFNGCDRLAKAVLPERLTKVPKNTFSKCGALREVTLGQSVTTIDDNAFLGTHLKEIKLPETLTTIGMSAFESAVLGETDARGNVTKYSKLVIPGSVTSIAVDAFKTCEGLEEVVFEDGEASTLTFSSNANLDGAFCGCNNLKKVTLPKRLQDTGDFTFQNCGKLEEVILGEGTVSIDDYCFEGCTNLKKVTGLGELKNLQVIGHSAFYNCTNLSDVVLPEGLLTIGAYAFYIAGMGTTNASGQIEDSTLVIPGTVTSIGSYAFYGCYHLGEVIFANGKAQKLDLGSGWIGGSDLKRVLLPERLTELYITDFDGFTNLSVLYIPPKVKVITGTLLRPHKLVIYGVAGSYAETWAKEHNIPFKTKSELGLSVTGIRLSPTSITRTLTKEELGHVTVPLYATILPETAQNRGVTYSCVGDAATVSETGLVTLEGYGTATITATADDTQNGTFKATCQVTVRQAWSEQEKAAAKAKLEDLNPGMLVLANTCTNLQEELQLNTTGADFTAEWKLPYMVQAGTNSCDVIVHKEGYEDAVIEGLTVTGIQIDGITLEGAADVKAGSTASLVVSVEANGGDMTADEVQAALEKLKFDGSRYEITWTSAKPAILTVKGDEANKKAGTVTGVKAGKGIAVTAKMVLKDSAGKNCSTAGADKGNTWFDASAKVNVLDVDVVNKIKVTVRDASSKEMSLADLNKLQNIETKTTVYTLTATAYSKDTPIADCPLTWSSTDTGVAKVAAVKGKNGEANLTIMGYGSATVRVGANKNGSFTQSFRVTLVDGKPRLESDQVQINLLQTDLSAQLGVYPSNGVAIGANAPELVNKDGSAQAMFDAAWVPGTEGGNKKICKITPKSGTKKGKYSLLLKVSAGSPAEPYSLPLTIQLTEQKPKVTVKQGDVLNLYESKGTGTMSITSDTLIDKIEYIPKVTSGAHVEANTKEIEITGTSAVLPYILKGADASSYKSAKNQGTLKVTFQGYGDNASYSKSVTLKVNKSLPKYTIQTMTFFPKTAANNATVTVTDAKTKKPVTCGEDGFQLKLKGTQPAGYTVTDQTNAFPRVALEEKAKAGKLTFELSHTDWISGIMIPLSCQVKIGKNPTLSFSNAKVILNKAYHGESYQPIEIRPYISGFEEIAITGITFTGKNADAKNALANGDIQLTYDAASGKILAEVVNEKAFTKNKSYTYTATASAAGGLSVSGSLNVTVSTKAAAVSLKASGKIDLADREGSAITYKISTSNFTDEIRTVSLAGSYANYFTLAHEDGEATATLKAKEGSQLKLKTQYPLQVKVTYQSGVELTKEVKVSLSQKNPKVTASVKTVTLYESAAGTEYGCPVAFDTTAQIKSVRLANYTESFGYEKQEDGTGILYVRDDADAKAGKTYKLKLEVTLQDAAVNAAPVSVTVSVKYQK